METVAGSVAILAAAPGLSSTARAERRADETAVYWTSAATKAHPVRRWSKRVRIRFGLGVCLPDAEPSEHVSRIKVARHSRSVVISVFLKGSREEDGICYGALKFTTRWVDLRGRLGARSVKDGYFSPPRVVISRPKAR